VTPPGVSKAGDVSDVDAVRPEPQSLSLVPTAAVINATDSEAMNSPETEMLAPGDASHPSFCSSVSDTHALSSQQATMQHAICLLHVCCLVRQHYTTEPVHRVRRAPSVSLLGQLRGN